MNVKPTYLPIVKTICLLVFINTSCTNKPASHVRAFETAMNGHQVSDILSFFAEDVSFKMGGYQGEGIMEFKKIAEWDSVLNAAYTFYDLQTYKDSVIFKAEITSDLMKVMGFESGIADPDIIKFKDGLISYISFNMTPEDKKKDQQIWGSFMLWAQDQKQDQINDLMPEGKFVIDGNTAKGWLELFQEWNKAIK